MSGNLTFDQVPEASRNVRYIGSLVFDRQADLGDAAFLDLTSEIVYTLLARDLISALYEHTRTGQVSSDLTVNAYATAIQEVLAYCGEMSFAPEFRLADFCFERLVDYRAYLNIRFSAQKSDVRRRRFGCLLRLLQAASETSLAPLDLTLPRNFPFTRDSDRTQPYPAGELLDLEGACRTHIRELVARIEWGKQLLADGIDPRGRPKSDPQTGRIMAKSPDEKRWNQLPNLLWYAVNVLDGRYLKRSELLAGHSSFNSSLMGTFGGSYRKADVYSHLYPQAEDFIPFVLLLAKTTGRNESSIFKLRRDCIREVNGRHVLWYEKDRGAARSYSKVVAHDGPFSPVQLIRQIRELTDPLVRFADAQERNRLFLGLTIKGHGREAVKALDPSYLKSQMNCENGWCDAHDLKTEDDQPLRASMRRLRVNYLTNRYKQTGQLAKVSRDAAHTMAGTTVSYVDNYSTKHLHEEAIERGILNARSLARVTIVPEDDIQKASKALNVDEGAAQQILDGKQDVFFAACRDFFNRPGGMPNTPCDQPWGCFFCANAVITSHVLPRVVRFRDFIEQQKSIVPAFEWEILYSEVSQVLQRDILPSFSRDAVAHAERLTAEEMFYVPLPMKG